ncbi:MAG TPA: YceI family protein [Leptospiraceae bacterium]|nr:YceI family protein [Leptospiraceae bacterium]
MKKILILSLALGLTYCDKAPEAPKAEAKPAVEAPKVEGTSVGLDLTKSTVKWIGTKLKGKHNGTVKIADGNILVKDNKIVGGKFSLDMTSIDDVDMKDDAKMKAKLEGHLKSEDFFNVEKFPKATFEITTITEEGASVNVTGNLTIKDVTKSVTFPAKITYGADKKPVSATANFNINRQLWNITYPGQPDNLIKDEINLDLNLIAL